MVWEILLPNLSYLKLLSKQGWQHMEIIDESKGDDSLVVIPTTP